MNKIHYQIYTFVSTVKQPYNIRLQKITKQKIRSWRTNIVCVPAEFVPKKSTMM